MRDFKKEWIDLRENLYAIIVGIPALLAMIGIGIFVIGMVLLIPLLFYGVIFGSIGAVALGVMHFFQSIF